jgi:hypothetical protein
MAAPRKNPPFSKIAANVCSPHMCVGELKVTGDLEYHTVFLVCRQSFLAFAARVTIRGSAISARRRMLWLLTVPTIALRQNQRRGQARLCTRQGQVAARGLGDFGGDGEAKAGA